MTWIFKGKFYAPESPEDYVRDHIDVIRGVHGKRFSSFYYPKVLVLIEELRPKQKQSYYQMAWRTKLLDIIAEPDRIKRFPLNLRNYK